MKSCFIVLVHAGHAFCTRLIPAYLNDESSTDSGLRQIYNKEGIGLCDFCCEVFSLENTFQRKSKRTERKSEFLEWEAAVGVEGKIFWK